ncbi:universal stress protein [Bacillota bacterium Lsc_1132]
MKSILFATDGSKSSERAGEMAKQFLEAWPEAQLHVLYVTAKENYAYDLVPDVVDNYEKKITNDIQENILEKLFGEWKERVHFIHEIGHPSTTICKVAKQQDVELIIVGSHGRSFFDRALLGSVAHAVLNRSELPVLVVR